MLERVDFHASDGFSVAFEVKFLKNSVFFCVFFICLCGLFIMKLLVGRFMICIKVFF